jgi:hypothetical protein
MPDHLVSVDAGNGGTNAVLAKSSGGYKSFYEPSIRTTVTGATLGLQNEVEFEYADWNGFRYATGDEALVANRRLVERHMGSNRYGDEFHQFLVANALAKLGVKDGEVDLTLFAPPGFYLQAKAAMEQHFRENNGEVTIKLKSDKKPRTWRYSRINVWPEGIGAAACFALDEKGSVVQNDVFEGETIILDCGAQTLDALKMVDGKFNPEMLEHATWDTGGLHIHVREPILRALRKRSDDFANLTVDDVDRILRQGLTGGSFVLRFAGLEVDLQPLFDKYRERYAEWVGNNICDGVFDGFKGIRSVILVGGGAVMIEEHLRKWYADKILDRSKQERTKKIHPVDMNAVGGLRLAMQTLKLA